MLDCLDWLYQYNIWTIAAIVLGTVFALAAGGFELARRFLLPRFKYDDGVNDAISGALGAIGVFYGVTVGLIAIDVWQRHSAAMDIAAREAAAIEAMYLSVKDDTPSTGPWNERSQKPDQKLVEIVGDYLTKVICVSWTEQKQGKTRTTRSKASEKEKEADWEALRTLRAKLTKVEPAAGKEGEKVRYAASLSALNHLSEMRRLRVDAASDRLSGVMWMIIILGAAMSMCVVYLFKLDDTRLHYALVSLLSAFLGLVILMIIANDRPFAGSTAIEPSSYVEVGWILGSKNEFSKMDLQAACRLALPSP